jgi:hypothetical protein
MSKHSDELRDIANEHDLGPYGADIKPSLRSAAAILDECEKALAPIRALADAVFYVHKDGWVMNDTKPDDRPLWGFDDVNLTYGDLRRARATLAKLRGE